MSRIHSITIPNPGPLFDTWAVIHYIPDDQDWKITDVELYTSEQLIQFGETATLIADGIQPEKFDPANRAKFFNALNDYVDGQRAARGYQRLVNDLNADAALARAFS